MKPEDVKLSLENNLLTIRGEKKQEAEERTERVHRYERSYGTFERAFVLPSTVDGEKISAEYQNGVLTVTVPKAERARPREIPVRARLSEFRRAPYSVVYGARSGACADCPPRGSPANLWAMLRDLSFHVVGISHHTAGHRAPRAIRVLPVGSRGLAPGSGRRRQHRTPALHLQSL